MNIQEIIAKKRDGKELNRDDINYIGYSNGYSYFEFFIAPEFANSTLTITPIFESGVLAITISTTISNKIIDATDLNNAQFAGYVTYNNKIVTNFTIPNNDIMQIDIFENQRYKVRQILLSNYSQELDISEFYIDGTLTLSREFLDYYKIEGNVGIFIDFDRLLWEEKEIELEYLAGLGTEENPYLIYSVDDLIFMMEKVNQGTFANEIKYSEASYVLMNDIDLNEMFWTPIGTKINPFNGIFDFNNHKVVGIYTVKFYEETHYGGLFGVIGEKAIFIVNHTSLWYIYLIIGLLLLLLLLLLILILSARKRKKNREEMSKK